jgi:biopolymer transport protein ExbD/biopolymer transport protein TolR
MAKQKAPDVVSDINVTPMVDVMLVLLIIFMVITPMLSKGKDVTKVKTKNDIKMVEADKEDAVLIAITRDKVKDLQTNRSDKTVYVKADARARFSAVTDVIDNLRTAQVDSVGLITENIPNKKTPVGM